MTDAVFIHSLFRAGSTYLFHVFRRSERAYWCYQEPLHEKVFFSRNEPYRLLEDARADKTVFHRHPRLDRPYFQELYDIWPSWKKNIKQSFIYDGYFGMDDDALGLPYWQTLTGAAKGIPVFQACRTAARIGLLKEKLGGHHIYLWRNPWDQWWSYEINPYFEMTSRIIVNASRVPRSVKLLCEALKIEPAGFENIDDAQAYFLSRPLRSEKSYALFYLLWLLGLQHGARQAHFLLNIDHLSDLPDYRDEMLAAFDKAGITNIDFSDCQVPQGIYGDEEKDFFLPIEERVHDCLKVGGWSQTELSQMLALRRQFQPLAWHLAVNELKPPMLLEQIRRIRVQERQSKDRKADLCHQGAVRVARAESRACQAESVAAQALSRAGQAESRAERAESRAERAESRAGQAESRAERAESRAGRAESRAERAEALAVQLNKTCQKLLRQCDQLKEMLAATYESASWKLTRPLRFLADKSKPSLRRLTKTRK